MNTTHGTTGRLTAGTTEKINSYVERYRSESLTDEQHARFAPRLRELVIAAEPQSCDDARAILGSASLMLADTDLGTSTVDELLSEANVAAWSNRVSSKQLSKRTMINHAARIARVQRVLRGLPGRVRKYGSSKVLSPAFDTGELALLAAAAGAHGEHAARGFAVTLGLGRVDVISGTFVLENGAWWHRQPNGTCQRALPIVADVAASFGDGRVRDGDVTTFQAAAHAAGLHVSFGTVVQTYRSLAIDIAMPTRDVLAEFGLSISAVEQALRHRRPVDVTTVEFVELLRGPVVRACAPAASAHSAARPPSSGESKERHVAHTRKASKAQAQRLAAQVRAQAAQTPSLPAKLQRLIDHYEPVEVTPEVWAAIRPVFLDAISRGQITGAESFKKHRVVIAGFLAWVFEQRRPLDIPTAFTYETIDAYYVAGLEGMEKSTRNEYRSRLKGIARRLNPGLESPIPASAGHVSVRPGYSASEEAAIVRVALRQRRVEQRRRTCIIVGLAGGGGLDAVDIRNQLTAGIIDRGDDGILVEVGGPRPRTVVIRRAYEPLVRAGLVGLGSSQYVLRNTGRESVNPVGRAIEDTETFDDTPAIDVARLRSTWLSWLMNEPVPLRVVMQTAGLKSARTLADLLPHLPAASDDLDWLRDGSSK
jgi:hypothetical protein